MNQNLKLKLKLKLKRICFDYSHEERVQDFIFCLRFDDDISLTWKTQVRLEFNYKNKLLGKKQNLLFENNSLAICFKGFCCLRIFRCFAENEKEIWWTLAVEYRQFWLQNPRYDINEIKQLQAAFYRTLLVRKVDFAYIWLYNHI